MKKEGIEELEELSGLKAFEVVRRRKKRKGGDSAALGIVLSSNTTTDSAVNGALIGTLSVVGGTGVYTFSFVANLGNLFAIVGSSLNVAGAPLTPGVDAIAVQADNGAGSVVVGAFAIIVTHSPVGYVPTYELLGF